MRRWLTMMISWGGALPLAAQGLCLPGPASHEAHTLATLSVPIAYSASIAPSTSRGLSVGVEGATLPIVDVADATPTTCRPDKGPENTRPLPGIARVRVAWSMPMVTIDAGWIPPVAINDVRADLFGVGVSHEHALGRGWSARLRAEAAVGDLHAPITCDADAVRDPASPCHDGTRSNDRWQPGVFGLEAAVGAGRGTIRPYAGVGLSWLRPRFQVDFTDSTGFTDRTRVEVNLTRVTLTGGATWYVGPSSLTAEVYATPADAMTFRVVARRRID